VNLRILALASIHLMRKKSHIVKVTPRPEPRFLRLGGVQMNRDPTVHQGLLCMAALTVLHGLLLHLKSRVLLARLESVVSPLRSDALKMHLLPQEQAPYGSQQGRLYLTSHHLSSVTRPQAYSRGCPLCSVDPHRLCYTFENLWFSTGDGETDVSPNPNRISDSMSGADASWMHRRETGAIRCVFT